jgi:hypothetical protein
MYKCPTLHAWLLERLLGAKAPPDRREKAAFSDESDPKTLVFHRSKSSVACLAITGTLMVRYGSQSGCGTDEFPMCAVAFIWESPGQANLGHLSPVESSERAPHPSDDGEALQ